MYGFAPACSTMQFILFATTIIPSGNFSNSNERNAESLDSSKYIGTLFIRFLDYSSYFSVLSLNQIFE